MKKLSMKTLITTVAMLGLFGIVRADEVVTETTQPVVSVAGEFSTDITFGDATTFGSPYTGLSFSGDGWVLNTNLSDGGVNIEEANYSWSVVDGLSLTFGSQAEPYGLAWGLHRPSSNWFVSTPRDHAVTNGVGFGLDKFGVGANLFWGGSTADVVDTSGVVTEEGMLDPVLQLLSRREDVRATLSIRACVPQAVNSTTVDGVVEQEWLIDVNVLSRIGYCYHPPYLVLGYGGRGVVLARNRMCILVNNLNVVTHSEGSSQIRMQMHSCVSYGKRS